jgi:tRNA-specific 2-thiouridylase
LWHYTIGQRARLPSREERWFVSRKGVGKEGKDVMVVPGA